MSQTKNVKYMDYKYVQTKIPAILYRKLLIKSAKLGLRLNKGVQKAIEIFVCDISEEDVIKINLEKDENE